MSDPFATFGDAFSQQPSQQQYPQQQQQQQQQFGYDDPWATMNSPQSPPPNAPHPCMPQQAPPVDDPWATTTAPHQQQQQQSGVISPPALPPNMTPPPLPTQQPTTMMVQPQAEAVPTTVVFNQEAGDAAPPSPIGDVSVVANENGPEVPVFQQGMQQPTMMTNQPPPMPMMMQPGMQPQPQPTMMQPMMQPVMQDQHIMQQPIMPNAMMPSQPPVQTSNAPLNPFEVASPLAMPIPQQPVMNVPPVMQNAAMPPIVNNAPTNPFGEEDLTGQMNNLSMQNNGTEGNGMLVKSDVANGYGAMMLPPPAAAAAAPSEFLAPVAPATFDQGQNGVPPMVQANGVPPNGYGAPPSHVAPPPSQPQIQSFEPSQSQHQQQRPQNGTMQAPLSPDPFAVYSPVVSPVVPLSPQVNDPFGYAFSPMTSPTEAQRAHAGFGGAAMPEMPNLNTSTTSSGGDPFGVFGQPPEQQALVPSNAVNDDPFGVFGAPTNAAPSDPFGSSTVDSSMNGGAMVVSNQVVDDPFGIFGSPTPVQPPPPATTSIVSAPQEPDPWSAAGFQTAAQTSLLSAHTTDDEDSSPPIELDCNSLPKQGDYYEARINARSLGAMFYTARDLEDTLLYRMPTNIIDSLKNRPIVAYVAEESAAYNSGVHLGHCILSVNGTEVSDPDECARVIRAASRPMNLRCYVMPELEVTLAEGKHMVKYDKKEMGAPLTALEWKEKYVVVGGIVAKPWMLNMYRSKVSWIS
ncbi:hypothetical protein HJC23_010885 [Cyclotella cryptica]|uniref:PDZ domain-containing protein n=1 Tax=Cyclotella cryptica TaxID=29204 RepID=A0ABD3NUW7_9STRA